MSSPRWRPAGPSSRSPRKTEPAQTRATVHGRVSDQENRDGETANVQLPEASQGRALLTLESGSAILEQRWLEAKPGANRVSIPITAGMAPGIYAAVTMVQPHAGKTNDRPIRLYGVIPLKVTDPQSHLTPLVTTAAEWAPQSKASVTVSEKSGRAMDYTLAVVDEGLLGRSAGRLHLGPVR